jgi:hypothetical protein
VKENIEENKVGRQMNFNDNKAAIKNYEETFNILNRNRNSVKQDPNEGDQEYINRIKSLEALKLDKSIYKEKAELEGSAPVVLLNPFWLRSIAYCYYVNYLLYWDACCC